MVVRELMTMKPEFVAPVTAIRDVVGKLQELDIRHLPVVEDGNLIGMISDRDVRSHLMPTSTELAAPEEAAARWDAPVSAVMTGGVLSVNTEAEIVEVIDLMIEQRVSAVPVVEATEGRLAGIISYVDVLQGARKLFE